MRFNHYIVDSPTISEVGLGAWQLGESTDWISMSEREAITMVHESLDLGINFFDTAPNYGNGTSESRLGKALRGIERSKIVINTKFGHTESGTTNFEADHIRASLESSLNRLQTDYVDSLIIHNPPHSYLDGNNNAHYAILERLMEEGKIRAYGASLDSSQEMELFMRTTNGKVIEAFYNILHQDAAKAFATAMAQGVAIIAKIPLDSGWLSGKYDEFSSFSDIRTRWSKADITTRAQLVRQIRSLVPDGRDLAQTAIAFCLADDAVSTVIPGNRTLAQLRSNVQSVGEPLSPMLVEQLKRFYDDEVRQLNLPW